MAGASSAADYRPVCDDCGSYAAGRGMFGDPYCGFCQKSIRDRDAEPVALAPVVRLSQYRIAA
jgi:hypothetical protein